MPNIVTPFRSPYSISSTYTRTDEPGIISNYGSTKGARDFALPDTRYTESNPNWRQLVSKKLDASTPYRRSVSSFKPSRLFVQSHGLATYAPAYYDATFFGNHNIDPVTQLGLVEEASSTLAGQAATSIKRKLAKHASTVNVMVPIVELREMRKLITYLANSGITLLSTLAAIQKGKSRGLNATKRAFTDAWLTWSFGVRPTLAEIDNISKAISNFLSQDRHFASFSSMAKKEWSTSMESTMYLCALGTKCTYQMEARHALSYRLVAGFDVNILASNNYGLDNQFGLDLNSVPSTLWELTPFSWLFDYFGTVGDYLDDTFWAPPGATTYICQTKRYAVEVIGTPHVVKNGSDTIYFTSSSSPFRYKYFSIIRTPLSALPFPPLRFRTVDEIGRNAVNKLLNLASIGAKSVRF